MHTYTHTYTRPHTRTHTHITHKHVVGPEFHLSQDQAAEGGTLVVYLSAPILTRPQTPAFTGRIEVDINAEDLPGCTAQFGKCFISLRCASIAIVCV